MFVHAGLIAAQTHGIYPVQAGTVALQTAGDFTGAFAPAGGLLVGLVVCAVAVFFFGRDRRRPPVERAVRWSLPARQAASRPAAAVGKRLQIGASHP